LTEAATTGRGGFWQAGSTMALRIAVLGPGGVGGFVAGALSHAGSDVTLIARPAAATAIAAGGLHVNSALLGEFDAPVSVVENATSPVDCLIVATKADGLDDALGRVAVDAPALVVPLLNGIEHLPTLRARYGAERVIAAVIRIESDRPRPGVIVQTSPGVRIDIADSPAGAPESTVQALTAELRAAGLDIRLGAREPDVMWSKLARLCPLALTTTASDRPLGFIRTDPRWRSALTNAVSETVAVAVAEGAQLDPADTIAELDGAHPELGSSMQRDVRAGRPSALDAIAGAVLRAGARHGLRCPTIQWLAGRIAETTATRPAARS
jgi:2-dehydropantoate 2-reductase